MLFVHGGVYIDLDSNIVRPLSKWVRDDDAAIISQENKPWSRCQAQYAGVFSHKRELGSMLIGEQKSWLQWMLLSAPRHPLLAEAIRLATQNVLEWGNGDGGHLTDVVVVMTGPLMWSAAINNTRALALDRQFRVLGVDFDGNAAFKDKGLSAELDKIKPSYANKEMMGTLFKRTTARTAAVVSDAAGGRGAASSRDTATAARVLEPPSTTGPGDANRGMGSQHRHRQGMDSVAGDGAAATAVATGAPPAGHPLWSRGWAPLVECRTVPNSYYTAKTEKRQSPEDMISWFGQCGGTVWLRTGSRWHSGPDHSDIDTFIAHVLPVMTKPFTLVTTDGDSPIPGSIKAAARLLKHPLLTAWHTQNYDGSLTDPKLRPVPIGFDLHSKRPGFCDRGGCGLAGWKSMVERRAAALSSRGGRPNQIVVDAMAFRYPARKEMHEGISCGLPVLFETTEETGNASFAHLHLRHMGLGDLWQEYASSTFGVSPRGNGLDCHRTWEMLFFGLIPIVQTSSLDQLYDGLPVVIINQWSDICKENLPELAARYAALFPVPAEVFTMEHWLSGA